ncbi:hypothetical protein OIU77_023277 [Salix suchowensis]|uniref:Uncharacterized protein n=1 Tax=Salix suchowensis TaxID=1278906 RepID=A0ABQ9C3D5_9ROSI|nr:hypothetical protein OIU77_023277 [Salix suchowensis]
MEPSREQRGVFLRMPAVQFIKILQMLPFDMPYDFMRKIHPGGDGEDYHEVRNVPEIYCTYQTKWQSENLLQLCKTRHSFEKAT